ncbi:MAG: L-seryl-tRNA(Sec) selenium transferase [Proteobacteria bacterium]|nr:L-seryl-tRNA(Sec) selenium transferase [Pseudomonadota bacterium]
MDNTLLRQLPKVDRLLSAPELGELPDTLRADTARRVLDELRTGILAGELTALPDVPALVLLRAKARQTQHLVRVINATGIVLHTNLGRAPLAQAACEAVHAVASGYSNAELLLETGLRGGRLDGIHDPLVELLGCEDAIAVNNNAAAVFLALSALGAGRECIVSRGELVEIGGSFRVPDIMALSGARLVEVGTTNRTRAADYQRAVTEDTGLVMRVHPSNFKVVGFTERPTTAELAEVAASARVPMIEDLGSGAMVPGLGDEPMVADVLRDGADLVLFSGDKLLGGPQAGILAGRRDLVQACRKHPLYRALRLDKMVLAALEATLRLYVAGRTDEIPTVGMLTLGRPDCAALVAGLDGCGLDVQVEDDVGFSGGGALPGHELPTRVVALRGVPPQDLAHALRTRSPAVVPRVARDAVLLDPRTLLPGEIDDVVAAVRQATIAR